jgi:peptidoglycan/LPS O-acetylase OafA/YrhL
MGRNRIILFVLVCILAGIATLIGSILGHFFGQTGLFAGAIIGGIIGVIASTRIALMRGALEPKRFISATIGGLLGFALAAVVATNHLNTPIVPLGSILLIGLGAVLGAGVRHRIRPNI